MNFSQSFSCPDCGISIEEIEPRSFSFNNPFGACPECSGIGSKLVIEENLLVRDENLSSINLWNNQTSIKEIIPAPNGFKIQVEANFPICGRLIAKISGSL